MHRFYELAADDPVLRPVYPARDLARRGASAAVPHSVLGRTETYNELRGHPRLRMRHARFVIGEAERDAWLRDMRIALDELSLDQALDAQLWDYLVMAAHSLVNRPADPGGRDLGLSPH